MGKVIDIFTRKEIVAGITSKQEGEALIENLLNFEMSRAANPFAGPVELIDNLITTVENGSGASRYEVMDRIYNKRKV